MTPVARTSYLCTACGTEYRNSGEAAACEARAANAKPKFKVGDIVTARAGFGWYDGDRNWIVNAKKVDPNKHGKPGPIVRRKCPNGHGNCFSPCCTFQFYYVVTLIDWDDRDPHLHRVRYHLVTNAMTGKHGYRAGYTFDEAHWLPKLVANIPLDVLGASRALIGEKATTRNWP